ncbi:hypothetical protein EGH21_00970 [Halomicroarcula sp. F13]|uniref:DUF7964 domain-containing protein n=1 Tax=Haloarcula rubra TaxID=2487747 RepID=A0AAW4PM13_9EURY|nr:hypothetical protein [Halomicroarcula rubra]MBX0321590.1 hypothetical protein [Halomicroarcula rubra]
MTTVTNLPRRPLAPPDVAELNGDDRIDVAPYGGVRDDGVRIYAVKLAVDDTAYALGFDDATEQWEHLLTVDAADLSAADDQLDTVLDEWAVETYGGSFDVVKPIG